MKVVEVFASVFLAGIVTFSQSQVLQGRILDMDSLPIADARLTLEKFGLSASSDSSGNFRLENTAIISKSRSIVTKPHLQIHNQIFTIVSSTKHSFKVRIFDGKGRICPIMMLMDKPGTYIGKIRTSVSGIFFVQVQSAESGVNWTARFIDGFSSGSALSGCSESVPMKMAQTILSGIDTLQCTKDGFLQKRVKIEFGKESMLTLYMYPETRQIAPSEYPVIDGSTSTQPVGIVLASMALGTTYGYTDNVDGSKKMVAFSTSNPSLADSINKYIVKHNSTHDAYVNVIRGSAGLALIARAPSEDEIRLADSLNVKIEAVPFALDAFVFLVNRKNPVDNITLDNVRKIYSGSVTDWTTLGGNDLKIKPYQRERNSGSQEMMVSLVMKDLPLINSADMVLYGMMGPFNVLNSDTAGIGYTVFFYGKNMAPVQYIKYLSIDGVAATTENIQNHTYPLWAHVYLVYRTDIDLKSNAAYLRELILAPQGQEMIARSGYVPVFNQ